MAGFRAVALYGLTVTPSEEPIPAFGYESYPATFKLTMAALDPFAKAEQNETTEGTDFKGATLKIIRIPNDESDSEDEYDDEDGMDLLEGLGDSDEDDDEDAEEDEDLVGGPSDPSKSAKALKIAALKEALAEAEDDDMEVDASPKLSAKAKGKAKALVDDEEELDEDEEDSDEDDVDEIEGPEEFVLCTLDPSKTYQQSLDITINEYETVYFQVSGTHAVHLTGNILVPDEGDDYDEEDSDEDEEDEYDLSPDEDELDLPDELDESDELDDIDDPRITELADDEVEAPALVKASKGKNKRSAPDSADTSMVDDVPAPAAVPLDDVAKAVNGDAKLSKKQKKKLKNNAGSAVDAPAAGATKEDLGEAVKPSPKSDKKVQFSKTLIQGPTPNGTSSADTSAKTAKVNGAVAPKAAAAAAATGSRTVQGVVIEDKKAGSGPAAKKGSKVSMRYIGKLFDTKQQFDANKKGKPFTFNLGKGEVIAGWEIGVAGMQVGGERRITIPANQAYGSKALPGIPANSKLVFDVKVLEIK